MRMQNNHSTTFLFREVGLRCISNNLDSPGGIEYVSFYPYPPHSLQYCNNRLLSIIFVHELLGHPERDWESREGIVWPRDMLPAEHLNARIWSFGWGSGLKHNMSLSSVASNPIVALADQRVEDKTVSDVTTTASIKQYQKIDICCSQRAERLHLHPTRLVFVGRGFGGTVVKKVGQRCQYRRGGLTV
jgi:hypothetical protein